PEACTIVLRTARVARVLGETLGTDEIESLLASIGFDPVRVGDDVRVTVPTWRGDVTAEIDLIEEVARLRGYDSFPVELRPFRPTNTSDDAEWLVARRVRELLVGM